ncbi:MAG: AMP-binding protein [Polyangiaceae bacterium]
MDATSEPTAHVGDGLDLLAIDSPDELSRDALVTDARTWSFEELARAASALAEQLRSWGIRPGARIAFVAEPSEVVLLTILTLTSMGVTLVPIHPRLSAAEAQVVLEVAGAERLLERDALTAAAHAAFAETAAAPAPVSAAASVSSAAPAPAPFAIVSTSGTTGRPKGAVLSRAAITFAAQASERNLGFEDGDRWLLHMPLAHVGGLSIVTRCLLARRTIVLLPRFDAASVLGAIRRHRVTLLSVVPTMLHALLEADTTSALAVPRAVLLGGAASSEALCRECARRNVRALTTYGLTEACSQVTTQPPRDPSTFASGSGPPLPGFEVHIARDDGSPAPAGDAGHILVRSPALFDGYVLDGGRSIDPARDAEGFFHTGDIGHLDERGHLHVLVRRTDLIVTGGENAYPVEIEQALEACPGVRRALVFGIPDERWGQIVAAAVEPAFDAERDPEASRQLLAALADLVPRTLAAHKRPRRIALVTELALTPSGKVDRKDAAPRHAAALRPFP